jgi:hypothetical protein
MIVSRVMNAAMPVLPFVTPVIILAVAVTARRAGARRALSAEHPPAPPSWPRLRKAVAALALAVQLNWRPAPRSRTSPDKEGIR